MRPNKVKTVAVRILSICSIYIFYLNRRASEDCHMWHETSCSVFVISQEYILFIAMTNVWTSGIWLR